MIQYTYLLRDWVEGFEALGEEVILVLSASSDSRRWGSWGRHRYDKCFDYVLGCLVGVCLSAGRGSCDGMRRGRDGEWMTCKVETSFEFFESRSAHQVRISLHFMCIKRKSYKLQGNDLVMQNLILI